MSYPVKQFFGGINAKKFSKKLEDITPMYKVLNANGITTSHLKLSEARKVWDAVSITNRKGVKIPLK